MAGMGTETAHLQANLRDIPALAAEFTAAHLELDLSQQRLVLATIRLLGQGAPVAPEAISDRTGLPFEEVTTLWVPEIQIRAISG